MVIRDIAAWRMPFLPMKTGTSCTRRSRADLDHLLHGGPPAGMLTRAIELHGVSKRNRSGEDRPNMGLGAKAFTPRSKRGG